jgi:hypothetical protein
MYFAFRPLPAGKGLKAKYIIVVGLFHSNAGKGLKAKYIIVVGL